MNKLIEQDLARSGLVPEDMDVWEIGTPERGLLYIPANVQGYAIPYYNFWGRRTDFYRGKLFVKDPKQPKYKQPPDTPNHIYFPKNFKNLFPSSKYVVITEGEKKAAAAAKAGICCVGLGGIDSWRSKSIILPPETTVNQSQDKQITANLPNTGETSHIEESHIYALGLREIIEQCREHEKHIIICYDTDQPNGLKYEVARAASALAIELRYEGIPFENIHLLVLPYFEGQKIGIDDYIQAEGGTSLRTLIRNLLNSGEKNFPRAPDIRGWVTKRLQRVQKDRKYIQRVGIGLLSDLDCRGDRLYCETEKQMYYFDRETATLHTVNMNNQNQRLMHQSGFGQMLYKRYGISAADQRILLWLDAQFYAESPIKEVKPNKVLVAQQILRDKGDQIVYQLSDTEFVRITPNEEDPIQIRHNGYDGILFNSEQVTPIASKEFVKAFNTLNARYKQGAIDFWWYNVIKHARIRQEEELKLATALLMYLSPWFYRWRGTQLPVEIYLGEPGSGKSSICEHRLNVLTGNPLLRNAPTDLRDWHASIANAGGLHVTDNVVLNDKNLRQRISDDLCRIITSPDPHVEMRRLYSNNELVTIPVQATFAITAIQQPFKNADIMQRAFVVPFDKSAYEQDGGIQYISDWVQKQMNDFGGRTMWLAHHAVVCHQLFRRIKEEWDFDYRASHRLINLEQLMILTAKHFGIDYTWIPKWLNASTTEYVTTTDWALEGLATFVKEFKQTHAEYRDMCIYATDICTWAQTHEQFRDCEQITNPRRLGRYMADYMHLIKSTCRIVKHDIRHNKIRYRILP